MDNDLISPIQKLLPGALSRWILGSSIALSVFLLMWPSYDLPAKYLADIEIVKLLLRLLLAGMPLLIGSISLIALLIYHNVKLNSSISVANEKIDHLQKRNVDLTKSADTFESIANSFQTLAEQSLSISKKTLVSHQDTIDNVKKTLSLP